MSVDDDRTSGAPWERRFAQPVAGDGPPATPVLAATTTPWVLDLIRRFRAAGGSMRVCTHLVDDPDQGAVWQAAVPDLRSCRRSACTEAVDGALEARLGHPLGEEPTRCTTCGRVGLAVRGVGVAVGPTMLRGTVCDDCLAAKPVPTPSAASDPISSGDRRPPELEVAAEPIAAGPEELASAAEERIPFDAVGRRALRRGALLAAACAGTTAAGLDPDQAVVGALVARAAQLAKGLGALPGDASVVHDLAFRSLVGTTTSLWWLLRAEPAAVVEASAAFRGSEAPVWGVGGLRDRLRDLGREADLAILRTSAPDAAPGSWRELAARHLTERPGGSALDHGRGDDAIGPLQALVAGEHLSLACADYADRMPTEIDPDEVRRLAEEVTTLRAVVEAALAERPSKGRFPV